MAACVRQKKLNNVEEKTIKHRWTVQPGMRYTTIEQSQQDSEYLFRRATHFSSLNEQSIMKPAASRVCK